MLEILVSVLVLCVLEIILSIDNVIFISILLEDLDVQKRKTLRMIGLGGALIARIILLASISYISHLNKHILFTVFDLNFTWHNIIMLLGGGFLIYKSITEIHEKYEEMSGLETKVKKYGSVFSIISQIILIDIVFSFDSILTAIGLSDQIYIMITAVVISMIAMLFLSEWVSKMIDKYPTIKNLALCFLIVVGFVLFLEGLHYDIPKQFIYIMIFFGISVELINITSNKRKPISELQSVKNNFNKLITNFDKLSKEEKDSILNDIEKWKSSKFPKAIDAASIAFKDTENIIIK